MEKKKEKTFTIYKEITITNPDGTLKTFTNDLGSTTLEKLQEDLIVATQQRDRMQELVDLDNKKIELANTSDINNIIIL